MAGKLREIFKGRQKCMCLEAVSDSLKPETLIESGWKQFGGTGKQPKFQMYHFNGNSDVPLDKWVTAEAINPGGKVSGGGYDAGFHIYVNELEQKTFSDLRRVYFRKAHTLGRQNSRTVAVAREMYVPSDPDAWPPRS